MTSYYIYNQVQNPTSGPSSPCWEVGVHLLPLAPFSRFSIDCLRTCPVCCGLAASTWNPLPLDILIALQISAQMLPRQTGVPWAFSTLKSSHHRHTTSLSVHLPILILFIYHHLVFMESAPALFMIYLPPLEGHFLKIPGSMSGPCPPLFSSI